MPSDFIETLIHRVPAETPTRAGAVRVRLDQTGAVAGSEGLLERLFKQYSDYDVVEETLVIGTVEVGPLTVEEPDTGRRGQLILVLTNARLPRGKAAQFAGLLFDAREGPGARFNHEIRRIAEAAIGRGAGKLTSAFNSAASRLSQDLAQDIAARTGVHTSVSLRKLGARGRGTVGPIQLEVDLVDYLAAPLSVKVEVDDDPERLPPHGERDPAAAEESLIRQTVTAALRERVRLQELVMAMPRVEARVTQDLKQALAPMARRLLRLELGLKLIVPRKTVNLLARRLISVGQRRYTIEANALATPRDAVLMARSPIADFEAWWQERLQYHADEVVPAHDHATVLLAFEPIAEMLNARLRADLEQHGYETGRVRSLCLDRPPRLPPSVPVASKLSIGVGVGDEALDVTLLASVECTDRKLWINKGEPDLREIVTTRVREWMEGTLRTEDRVVALRKFESHRQEAVQMVQAELAAVGAKLASRLDLGPALRLEPTDDTSVPERVPFEGAMALKYDGGARSAELSFTGLATLMSDGRWVYLSNPVPLRERLVTRARELLEDVFRGATREGAVTGFDAMVRRVRTQLEQELPLLGYALGDLAVHAPSLSVTAPATVDVPFSAETRLGKADDTVSLRGVLELTLKDRAAWLRAEEPEIADWASRHAQIVFERVIRAAVPSQVDAAPETLKTKVENLLQPYLSRIGYLIRAMPCHLSAHPARPREFEEIVTPITLHMRHREREVKAVVQMKLANLARWRDAGVRDIQGWAIEQINAITKTRLFKESYTSLLEEAEGVGGSGGLAGTGPFVHIEHEMNEIARGIGYTVSKVMTLDDGEATRLLEGFPIHVYGDYTTALHHHAFTIHIRGEARADRLDDIRALLDRDMDVIERAHEAINTRLQAHIAQLNPNDLAFRFTLNEGGSPSQEPALAPSSGARSPRQSLLATVSEVLAKMGLVGVDLSVQIELPELFKRVQPLRGQLLHMKLVLGAREHRIPMTYTVQARIDDLSPIGQDLDLAYLPSVAELQVDLERYLTAELTEWGASQLVVRGSDQYEQLKRAVDDLIRRYSFSQMKLNIVLCSLLREPTFADGKYDRNLREAEEAMKHFTEMRQLLRAQIKELTEQRDYKGAEEAQKRLLAHEKQRPTQRTPLLTSAGADAIPAGMLPEEDETPLSEVDLQVPAPQGGYLCAALDQRLQLDLAIAYSPRPHVTEAMVARAARDAVGGALSTVDPLEFHLGFHKPHRGRLFVNELADALRRALLGQFADPRGACEVSFPRCPDPRTRDLRDSLLGARHHLSAGLPRGQAERDATLHMDIEVEDVAYDGLSSFLALVEGVGEFKASAERCLKRVAAGLSANGAQLPDDGALAAQVQEAVRKDLGLDIRVSGLRVQLLFTRSESEQLERIERDIHQADTRRQQVEADPLECDAAGEVARLDARIALLKRQRAEIQSRVA